MKRPHLFELLVSFALVLSTSTQRAEGQCGINEGAKLTAPDADEQDNFGNSISISGNAVLVGSWENDNPGRGSAYIYRLNGTSWTEEQTLTASDGAPHDGFGSGVSISGDVAVVGAWENDDVGANSGSAYVFRFDGRTWAEEQKLTASDAASLDDFGFSVAIDGHVALIASLHDDDAGSSSGSVYAYRFDGSEWVEEEKLTASDAAAGDNFGYSVSISGNVALVGAYQNDDAGANSGSAYVYRFDGNTWTEEQKLTASDAAAGAAFGNSVSMSGDVALIGAFGNALTGSAYVFRFDETNMQWVEEQRLAASDGGSNDRFGWSVSVSEDLAVVGARNDDDAAANSGSAYLYRFDGSTWIEELKLTASDAAQTDYFGNAVSISEGVAAIGAFLDDDGGYNSGSAYVFGAAPALSDPPCGAIDARQTSAPDGSAAAGWDSIALTFDEPTGALSAEDFAVVVSPPGVAPVVTDAMIDGSTTTVHFDSFIPSGAWTTITHWPTGAVTRVGYLPADVNNDKISNPGDILAVIDSLNGVTPLPDYATDADRSGVADPSDILMVIDLLNGAGSYDPWLDQSLP